MFDSYRQGVDPYDHQWRKKHVWIILTRVCRKWRALVFASASRLDLGVTVGPQKPDHIKTILSSPLPIFIEYKCSYRKMTHSAHWRVRAALGHHDRVRAIAFEGTRANFYKFFNATNCPFPVLESLPFALDAATKQRSQIHFLGDQINQFCIYAVLNCTRFPSHPRPDFYCPQRLSPNSLCESILPLVHQQKRPFSPVCKACLAWVISICPYYPTLSSPLHGQLPKILSHFQN